MNKTEVKAALKVAFIALAAYATVSWVQRRGSAIPVVGGYLPR